MANRAQLSRQLGLTDASEFGSNVTKRGLELEGICRRVGRRLSTWLSQNQGVLPSEEWTEAFRYYQAAVISLLKEQRERAKVSDKAKAKMTDAELDAQLRKQLTKALDNLTPEEWILIEQAMAAHRRDDRTVS